MLSVSDLPKLNAILNFTSAVLLGTGFYFIKHERIDAHKAVWWPRSSSAWRF